ncbi:hypothetical protein [Bradyrhizobium sp. USDA 4486]
MTDDEWGAAVLEISSTLAAIDRNVRFGGLRESLLEVWRLIALAPTPIRQTYAQVRESEILAVAAEFEPNKPDCGLSFDSVEDVRSVVMRLGGFLRALETEFMSLVLAAGLDRRKSGWSASLQKMPILCR